ncbi:hypothetical protein PG987_000092 [Apiospora arundinis]
MSSHSISDVLAKFEALLCQFEEEDIQHEDTAMEFSDLYLMAQEVLQLSRLSTPAEFDGYVREEFLLYQVLATTLRASRSG